MVFTDQTFAAARCPIHGDTAWDDFEISLQPHPAFGGSCLWWPVKLIELGIITKEEVIESNRLVEAEQKKRDEAQERATLQRLLAKYDPALKTPGGP